MSKKLPPGFSDTKNSKKQISPHTLSKHMADEAIAFKILDIIDRDKNLSQRKIMLKTGLAAGLIHSFMRKVIKKGWVRAKKVSAKRWLYFLSPEGFIEKSRLSIKYLSRTFHAYSMAQNLIQSLLDHCLENKWSRLVIAGSNEFAEIFALNVVAMDSIALAGIVAGDDHERSIAGYTALPYESLDELDYHRILVCDNSFLEWWCVTGNSAEDSRLLLLSSSVVGRNIELNPTQILI